MITSRSELDAAYNNAAAVKNSAAIVEDWTRRSTLLRNKYQKTLDLKYGSEERNRCERTIKRYEAFLEVGSGS